MPRDRNRADEAAVLGRLLLAMDRDLWRAIVGRPKPDGEPMTLNRALGRPDESTAMVGYFDLRPAA